MQAERRLWGIHNDAYGQELIDEGYISIGWSELGDLRRLGNDQVIMREAVAASYPGIKPGAVAGWAATVRRFAFEAAVGDLVIFPNKQDRTLNFGQISGGYEFVAGAIQPHRRSVRWIKTGVARSLFSQPALYEVGSALTMFAVRNNATEFITYIDASTEDQFVEEQPRVVQPRSDEDAVEAASSMPSAERIDQHTRDYVAAMLLTELSHEEFEHFAADLLRCLGYQARVTQFGGDGGVDVIAHKDQLGLEPPIIKVQCKHTVATQGRPVVQQLIGTLAKDEAGLFLTLGNFSAEALAVERERQNLRLFSGADITELVLLNYDQLPTRWRAKLPLRRVLAVDVDV